MLIVAFFQEIKGYYDQNQAKLYWDLTRIAYCNVQNIQNWNCDLCQSKYSSFINVTVIQSSDNDLLCFLIFDSVNQIVYISFRGTNNLENWITNLNATHIEYPLCDGCEVHQGFYEAYQELQPQLIEKLSLYASSNTPIYIIGHSLGGALVIHAALDIANQNLGNIQLVSTFGQPRVGNEQFANFYNSLGIPTYRLTHYKDPVPHLPFKSMGYYHVSTEVFYNEDFTNYQVCNGGEDPNCSNQYSVADDFSDHSSYFGGEPKGYCNASSELEIFKKNFLQQIVYN